MVDSFDKKPNLSGLKGLPGNDVADDGTLASPYGEEDLVNEGDDVDPILVSILEEIIHGSKVNGGQPRNSLSEFLARLQAEGLLDEGLYPLEGGHGLGVVDSVPNLVNTLGEFPLISDFSNLKPFSDQLDGRGGFWDADDTRVPGQIGPNHYDAEYFRGLSEDVGKFVGPKGFSELYLTELFGAADGGQRSPEIIPMLRSEEFGLDGLEGSEGMDEAVVGNDEIRSMLDGLLEGFPKENKDISLIGDGGSYGKFPNKK